MNTHRTSPDATDDADLPAMVTAGMMGTMAYGSGEVTKDLSDALTLVLGRTPETPEPIVLLAWYLDSLAKEYGLSESLDLDVNPFDRVDVPASAAALINHYLTDPAASGDATLLRDWLYSVFVDLSQDRRSRGILNKNRPLSDFDLLHLAQVYWNLEHTKQRSRLPIAAQQPITVNGQERRADIKVPGAQKDFATMTWTARVNEKEAHKSSGQSFRSQGARLAVLTAEHLINATTEPPPPLSGVRLELVCDNRGRSRVTTIIWPETELLVPHPAGQPQAIPSDTPVILVGRPAGVGAGYQRRSFDSEIDHLWGDDGDRRVWLVGGPGMGKSYTAGRVAADALATRGKDRQTLVMWVDSAGAESVTAAYAEAFDRLREHGIPVRGGGESVEAKARALLDTLTTSTWRWLVVLDNADPAGVIEEGLVPWGRNPNGRILVTTLVSDHRIRRNGRVVTVGLFTPQEAEKYLRDEVHSRVWGRGPISAAPTPDTATLARTVGYHPLALSIAAGTITANAMTVADWISDFSQAPVMDAAADESDQGGYPHLIGTAWQVALAKASRGLPAGVVERAAMVAALQDPDGHPTWLWDEEAVATWVTGELAPRRSGMPAAVRRLVEYGIVELQGDSWKQGRLAIHQLAARAVREQSDASALAEVATRLVDAWLLQLTGDESLAQPRQIRANLRPIDALRDLPTTVRNAINALLRFGRAASAESLARQKDDLDALTPYLARGGATGREELAGELADLADTQSELGRLDDSLETYSQASRLHREVIDDPSVEDRVRAASLGRLGDVELKLGRPDAAQTDFARAAQILERLLDNESSTSDLIRLADLYDKLGMPERRDPLLVRIDEVLRPSARYHSIVTESSAATAQLWQRFGCLLGRVGRTADSKNYLARAADVHRQLGTGWDRYDLENLARLHIADSEWDEAEAVLSRLVAGEQYPMLTTDAHVLLASVQERMGRLDDAGANLAIAAGGVKQDESEDDRARRTPVPRTETEVSLTELTSRLTELALRMRASRLGRAATQAMKWDRWDDAVALSHSQLEVLEQYAEGGNANDETDLAQVHKSLGMSYPEVGRLDKAADHLARAAAITGVLAELDPSNELAQAELAGTYALLADVYIKVGLPHDAVGALAQSIAGHENLASREARCYNRTLHSIALRMLSAEYADLGRGDEAVVCATRRLDLWRVAANSGSEDMASQLELADAHSFLGTVLYNVGRLDDADGSLVQAAETWQNAVRLHPSDRTSRSRLADAHGMVGGIRLLRGFPDEAIGWLSQAVDHRQLVAESSPGDYDAQGRLATGLAQLAEALDRVGRLEDASDTFARSVNIFQLMADLDPGKYEQFLLACLRAHADALRRLGREAEANRASAQADELTKRFPDLDA